MSIAKQASFQANPYHRFIEGKDPLKVLSSTHARIVKLIEGLTPRQIGTRVTADKWSIHEIIAHLADVELVHSGRCRWMAFEDDPTLVAFDQDAWSRGWTREHEPVRETLERFRALRQSQLRLFRDMPPRDLDRTGRHTEAGPQVFRDYIAKSAGHDLNHLIQIGDLRKKLLSRTR